MGVTSDIRAGMQVLGSDGGMVGRVIGLHHDHIHVVPTAPSPANEHVVSEDWIARVDDHVHLDREAALIRETWGTGEPGVAIAPELLARQQKKSRTFWMIVAAIVFAALYLLSRG